MAESQNGHFESKCFEPESSKPKDAEQNDLNLPTAAPAPQEEQADLLNELAVLVRTIARQCEGDEIALLSLLRQLEALHREVCDGEFQSALPENRQALYALLRDIEAGGGWPYIPRMKLQGFLKRLPVADQDAITQILESSLSSGNHHPHR
ncbi:hypothetical protein [Leptolyngbya ohadii]|uniref:hypothetical protein n=1 Tax=Leptolyngbya ohadii TaxID=1962290 RepID=UPI0021F12662|nr:hypothetical protein [Leptolyngbya ohadii]